MTPARRIRIVAAVAAGALLTAVAARATSRQALPVCPSTPTPVISADALADVCIPDGFKEIPMEYFDDYSWRAFVSLIWPAQPGRRGIPETSRPISAAGPRVFETYKPIWEVFHADGSAPASSFSAYDAAAHNPCGVSSSFGDIVVGSVNGIDDIGQTGGGSLDPPLVAQNGRYVRTLTLFNKLQFDHIVANRFFLRSALPEVPRPRPEQPVMEFPMGSMAVKTSWIDMDGVPESLVKRFYTRTAMVKRATGGGCDRKTIGLAGMHIAQKTPSRPQWIWSSFEQRDMVPPAWPDAPGVFVLHDGTNAQMPAANPLTLVPLAPEPARPFNVVRAQHAPLLTMTELTNFAYRRLLAGTPWQHYHLVVTQWPRMDGNQATPIPATQDGTVPNTFPGTAAFSAFANLTMETFDQGSIQLGCMNCHNRVRLQTDFMWTVADHAYPPLFPVTPRAALTAQ